MKIRQKKCVQKQRIYRRWGGLAKLAIEICGKRSMVYKVLKGVATSEPVERAIEEARAQLRARVKRRAA